MENFYTSISLSLFDEAIQYASRNIKKSHIFKTTNPEKKKNSVGPDFHIPMASNVETEVWELVKIIILNKLSNVIEKHRIGLYRNDGLGLFERLSGKQTE